MPININDYADKPLPTYYGATDAHNIGNENFQFTDPSTWGEALEDTGKFILASAYSGANGFINSGIAIANIFGADLEENDTAAQLSALDDDLGKYYEENREYADLAGFIVGSFVPGLAGVKLLNAGKEALLLAKTGEAGKNVSGALSLLQSPSTLAKIAAEDIAASQASFTLMTRGTAKALASGVTAGTMEGIAFEAAVQATMFKSPVLDEQDAGDIVQSFVIAGAAGGILGGIIEGARTLSGIKKAVKEINEVEKPYTFINELSKGQSNANRVIQAYEDLTFTPSVIPSTDDVSRKLSSLREQKVSRLKNDIFTYVNGLVAKDAADIGNAFSEVTLAMGLKNVENTFTGLTAIGRVSTKLPAETRIGKVDKFLTKVGVVEGAGADEEIKFIRMHGENAGAVTDEVPPILSLADKLADTKQIDGFVAGKKFKSGKIFNALDHDHYTTEARQIWAETHVPKNDELVHVYDFPVQQKIWKEWSKQGNNLQELEKGATPLQQIRVQMTDGTVTAFNNADDFLRHIRRSKAEFAEDALNDMKLNGKDLLHAHDEIAKKSDVRISWLNGKNSKNELDDLFATDSFAKEYTDKLVAAGARSQNQGVVDILRKPQTLKASYKVDDLKDVDGNLLRGAAYVAAKEKLIRTTTENAVAHNMGDLYAQFPAIPKKLLMKANQFGAGPGLLSFANGAYGSLASFTEQIGSATSRLQNKFKDATKVKLEASAYQMANNPEFALEFEAISRKILSTSHHYILDDTGNLVIRELADYKAAIAKGETNVKVPVIQEDAPKVIEIKNQVVRDAIAAQIEVNGKRLNGYKEIRAAQGLEDHKDPRTFYPPRANPNDYQHFAFVYDSTLTKGSAGHTSMIFAASEKELSQLVDKVKASGYKTATKNEVEEFKRARGEYEYERTLHENYIDTDLRRRGIASNFFPKTDSRKIANDWLESNFRQDDVFARELVHAKYQPEFAELRRLGEQYTNVSTSKFGNSFRFAEDKVKNPYLDYVRTALNINQASKYPLLQGFNEIVDAGFSRAWQSISNVWTGVKSPQDLEKVNKLLSDYGVKTAFYDAATDILANHPAPRGELNKFVRRANGILATLTLRMDPLNALNNAVGANVLLGSEVNSLVRAITRRDADAAGALSNLLDVTLPGVGDKIRSGSKLIGNSMQRYFSEEGKALKELYRKEGFITDIITQYDSIIDDLSLRGVENVAELEGRVARATAKARKFADAAEKVTLNKHAEEFNRFIAADVMKQITDIGVQAGVIGEKDALAYIRTFVNRTQGNMQASQRPLLFNGAVGQAVGLFQTYQFNLAQQLFRYIGQGTGKDAAMLLGLQGTLYGLNGLPAFNYINTHIVGSMSGNPQHKDLYTTTYGIFGKDVGDFLVYGLPSNLISTNLYTRGDINPRQVSVIPVNPADIAIVNATGKVFGMMKDAATNITNGGEVWQTMLQGIEHNGLSRPLAGIAQTAQALTNGGESFATSARGTIVGQNDFWSIATLSRLAGGRPLDEAITLDAMYRKTVYASLDTTRKKELVKAIKSQGIGSGQVSGDEITQFAERYAELGGDTKRFNQYVYKQVVSANTSEADKILQNLKNPYAKNLQVIMGGIEDTGE